MEHPYDLDNIIIDLKSKGYENEWIKMYLIKKFQTINKDHIVDAIARISQMEFRKKIIERDKVCIISGYDSIECEAAHIIPYSECKSYETSNGILLNACLHKLFDQYIFSINPLTMKVEIINESDGISINNYKNKDIQIPSECIDSLRKHYDKFINLGQKNN